MSTVSTTLPTYSPAALQVIRALVNERTELERQAQQLAQELEDLLDGLDNGRDLDALLCGEGIILSASKGGIDE